MAQPKQERIEDEKMSKKNQGGNQVLKQIVAKFYNTRSDKVDITSVTWDEYNRQIILCKVKGFAYKIIRQNGIIQTTFRVI